MRSIRFRATAVLLLAGAVFTAGATGASHERADGMQAPPPSRLAPSPLPLATPLPLDPVTASETEPNDSAATANGLALIGGASRLTAFLNIAGDSVDWFAVDAQAGDHLFAATMTSASSSGATDTTLDVIAPNGTTVIETDLDDGSFSAWASSIAGTLLPTAGRYYVRVRAGGAGTAPLRPYDLYVQLRSGAPTPAGDPGPIGTSAWLSGSVSLSDFDAFVVPLAAGDTIYVALDENPARGATDGDLDLRVGFFDNEVYELQNPGTGTTPDSEAFLMTVLTAGDYLISVDGNAPAASNYTMSLTVFPAAPRTALCSSVTRTTPTPTIDAGVTAIPFAVVGNTVIEDIDLSLALTHARVRDLDVSLQAPNGNEVVLFTDIGASSSTTLDVRIDDEAALPLGVFPFHANGAFRPEAQARLEYFDGTNPNGTWNLVIRDGFSMATGSVSRVELRVCTAPISPPPDCPPGFARETRHQATFETSADGYTHSGTGDEWERGLPTIGCQSGNGCWKTDLDGFYNPNSTQDLVSPPIDLTGLTPPVVATWFDYSMMEDAAADRYTVSATSSALPGGVVLSDWTGARMAQGVNVGGTVFMSSGWGRRVASLSALAGASDARLRFHLDANASGELVGVGVDNVTVVGCRQFVGNDIGIAIDDAVTTVMPGETVSYTTVASSPAAASGPIGALVAVAFDAQLVACASTCTAPAGGFCGINASGDVAGNVLLMPGTSATITSTCGVPLTATATLTSTATLTDLSGTDPSETNNTATDIDTIAPRPDAMFANGFE